MIVLLLAVAAGALASTAAEVRGWPVWRSLALGALVAMIVSLILNLIGVLL